MAPEKRLGRREFLATTAAAIGASAMGCKGNTPVFDYGPEKPPPDPVVAEIEGDSALSVPALGNPASGVFDSSNSTGPISSRNWTMKKDDDPFPGARTEDLGGEVTARFGFLRPGTYTVKLEIKGWGSRSTKEHQIAINPPSLPGDDYPLIAFVGHEPGATEDVIYLMHPSQPSQAHLLVANPTLWGQIITWERSGRRWATDAGAGRLGIYVHDLLTDDLTTIYRGNDLMRPSWNPKKDWIAALEGGRAAYLEPVLVRPDGSEALYVAGDTPSSEVSGNYLSWCSEGERLVLANANFDVTGGLQEGWGWDRRAAIYEGFWSGAGSTRVQIPTEDQITALMDSFGELNDYNRRVFYIGMGGLSWSPDGEELAYRIEWGADSGSRRLIAKSRVDGTGDIQVLVPEVSTHSNFCPVWSPDGQSILFTRVTTAGESLGLFKVPSHGGTPQVFSPPGLEAGPATWYQ